MLWLQAWIETYLRTADEEGTIWELQGELEVLQPSVASVALLLHPLEISCPLAKIKHQLPASCHEFPFLIIDQLIAMYAWKWIQLLQRTHYT